MKKIFTSVFFIVVALFTFAQKEEPIPQESVSHEQWESLLKLYVNVPGNVNYEGFKRDKDKLESYVSYLKSMPIQDEWTDDAKKAYWLNIYNAYVVKIVVDNYPVKSINDIKNAFGQKVILIGEKDIYSLNDVEDMLRKMKDPRVHFGMTKAAMSSPKLSNIAFTYENVDKRLEALAINFLNTPNKNMISTEEVKLNEIFKTYAKDFPSKGALIDFLNKYARAEIDAKAKISYLEFNWNLNK
ncbi:MAG: DUF547 domain-containing protein [Bacteroidia bacterium]